MKLLPDGARRSRSEPPAEADLEQSDVDEEPPARGPWRRAYGHALSVWGPAVIAYFLINCMVWMTRSEAGPRVGGFLEVWDRWDTGHYVTIALHGYNPLTENPAFFPLYPMLMRILEPVLPGGMLSAGMIIASVACVISLAVLYRLAEDLFDEPMARRTTFYLMAYPYAFFLVSAYNESLFLALAVGSLYYMRRGNWWIAGVLGGFASATRQAGALLVIAFAVEYLRQRDWKVRAVRADALAICLVPVGVTLFALYDWYLFGDPLKFIHVQAAWGRALTTPWDGAIRAWNYAVAASVDGAIFQPASVLNVIDVIVLLVGTLFLVLAVVGPWKLGRESWYLVVFSAVSWIAVVCNPSALNLPMHGLARYSIELVPVFLVLARMGANKNAERFYLLPAIAVQGVMVLSWLYGIWLA